MIITPIDANKDLYSIKDIIPQTLLQEIDSIDISNLNYDKWDWYDHSRKKIDVASGSLFNRLQKHMLDSKNKMSDLLEFEVKHIDSTFWLDQSGFTFPVHTDNPGVNVAMQIYLNDCDNAGTTFYQISENDIREQNDAQHWHYVGENPPTNVRHTFDFIKNTGYLMVNHKTQLHGVPGKLKDGQHRLSMYCWIN